MDITTRRTKPSDKDFVRDVHHRGYYDVVVTQFGDWDLARQDEFFESKWTNQKLQIVLSDETPCGFVSLDDTDEEVRLNELVIHPDSQGQGIGTKIMHQIIETANDRQVPVRLQVLLCNRAIELYRRLEFVEYGRSQTHVLMERPYHD